MSIVSVVIADHMGKRLVSIAPDYVHHAGSTMKLAVMIELFRMFDARTLRPDSSLMVHNDFKSVVDSRPFELEVAFDNHAPLYRYVGQTVPVATLIELMVAESSNLATNLLFDLIDLQSMQATLAELGAEHTQVLRRVEDRTAHHRGIDNRTCAEDLVRLMLALSLGTAASELSCRIMFAILRRQRHRDGIPAGLPRDVPCANLTGWLSFMFHDIAYIGDPGSGYVACVMQSDIRDSAEARATAQAVAHDLWGARDVPDEMQWRVSGRAH